MTNDGLPAHLLRYPGGDRPSITPPMDPERERLAFSEGKRKRAPREETMSEIDSTKLDHASGRRDIAEALGCSTGTVHQHLKKLGITFKGRTPEQHQRLMESLDNRKGRVGTARKAAKPKPRKPRPKAARKRPAPTVATASAASKTLAALECIDQDDIQVRAQARLGELRRELDKIMVRVASLNDRIVEYEQLLGEAA